MNNRPRVTDHALLRYLQRVKGLDVEAIRRHIEDICSGNGGASSIKAEGVRFALTQGGQVVVSATPVGEYPNALRRERCANGGARP